MNIVYAPSYLYLLFLFLVSYNFPSTGLLYPWLDLLLGILFFEAILNRIIFLISLSDSSLLAYKNATDFWILILYPATLLNSFTSSSTFLVEPLRLSMYSIMPSADKDSFTSSFPIWISFISFSCLTAKTKNQFLLYELRFLCILLASMKLWQDNI